MPPTLTDNTSNPIVLYSGTTIDPFTALAVSDPIIISNGVPLASSGVLTITLSAPSGATSNLGTLSQTRFPSVASFSIPTNTLTENTLVERENPTDPTDILAGTAYTAPTIAPGTTSIIDASVSYTHVGGDTVTDSQPVQFEIIAPPAPTVTGPNQGNIALAPGQTLTPFKNVTVTEPTSIQTAIPEVITVRLGTPAPGNPYPFYAGSGGSSPGFAEDGTISDPLGTGTFDANTNIFTETVNYVPGEPDPAQIIVNRLVYTPPIQQAGHGEYLAMGLSINGSDGANGNLYASYSNPGYEVGLLAVTPPAITAAPPVSVAAGQGISPFMGVSVNDDLGVVFFGPINVDTTIVITDNGVATDADGTLSGPYLTKTGIGTYQLDKTIAYVIPSELSNLTFTSSPLSANTTRTDVFTLTVADDNPGQFVSSGLTSTAVGRTVTTYGPETSDVTPVTIGSGPDALVLSISDDAYQGDAQFTISVDGIQQGGVQTATASHATGQDQDYTIRGMFGSTEHSVTVNFLNDNGGYGATDRNLYVDGATINGAAIPNSSFVEYSGGPRSITFTGNGLSPASPTVVGNGPDMFQFQISEDAYQGDAQFTFSIDGFQIGGIQSTSALHSLGQDQIFLVEGKFGPGPHTATVNFLNDNGGYGATDRNLYVDSLGYNGTQVTNGSTPLYNGGPVNFAVPDTTVQTSDTLTVGLTEDAYQGDAIASIALDGVTLGSPTVTFLNSTGTAEEFTYPGNFGGASASHTLAVSFLNDNSGFGSTDRNLYVKDVSFDGAALPDTSTLYSSGTVSTTFQGNQVISPFPSQH